MTDSDNKDQAEEPADKAEAPKSEPPAGSAKASEDSDEAVGEVVEGGDAGDADKPDAKTGAESFEEPLDRGTLIQLGVLCAALWGVAIFLLVSNYSNTRLNLYLGNMTQSLARSGRIDSADIDALVAMGPSILPTLEKDLKDPKSDPRLCIGILAVVSKIDAPESRKVLSDTLAHKNGQVRNNAALHLMKRQSADDNKAMLRSLIKSSEAGEKHQILDRVAPCFKDPKDALSFYCEILKDPDENARAYALRYINGYKGAKFKLPKKVYLAPVDITGQFADRILSWIKAGADKDKAPVFPKWSAPADPKDKDSEEPSDDAPKNDDKAAADKPAEDKPAENKTENKSENKPAPGQ